MRETIECKCGFKLDMKGLSYRLIIKELRACLVTAKLFCDQCCIMLIKEKIKELEVK